jgi:HpcH/HpaI aldolase/citrate lyase family
VSQEGELIKARSQSDEEMNFHDFSLLLFSTDPWLIRHTVTSGISAIVVDLETLGKAQRQNGADTEVNHNTIEDLKRVRDATPAHVICRINGFNPATVDEVEQVINAGADELLLPMVRNAGQVEAVLSMVQGCAKLGILIETNEAVNRIETLARLPLSRIYIGLNDLAIERGSFNIFTALVDGTVERLRKKVINLPFGFGGLTLPDCGFPIPCRLLIGEMVRLQCHFSFLRRSFHRDIRNREIGVETRRLLEAIGRAKDRSPEQITEDRNALEIAVRDWWRIILRSRGEALNG